jgi:D-amino-acid oxidase
MRVTVLGAGVIGLTTALRLQEAGCEVGIVAADPLESSTSYLAAGVFFPTHVGPRARVEPWARRAYQVLADHAARGVPGAAMRESMALYREPPAEPDWAAAVGGVRPAAPSELPPGYRYGLRYLVPMAETPRYLPWLLSRFREGGGRLSTRRVASLSELAGPGVDAIVNCSGLAARELAGDPSVYPVRGQIARVTNPGLSVSIRDEQHPEGRAYVHPRSADCVLGGTLEEGNGDLAVDPAVAAAILRRCRELAPELAGASVIEHRVGLRPGRPTVRLEEGKPDPAGTRVVHNYGHGGAGVTLAWGCAEDVVRLLAP